MSKHTYHAIFTIVDKHIAFDKTYNNYEVTFLEIDDLKISNLYNDKNLLYETKIELMKYLYDLLKHENQLPSSNVTKDINLKNNQFIKEIAVDTDVILEVFDNKYDSTFSEISCFASCEGICRRVLSDIKKHYKNISIDALKIYYEIDKIKLSSSYKNIIELGELLKLLDQDKDGFEKFKREQELKKLMNETIEKNIIVLKELAKYD